MIKTIRIPVERVLKAKESIRKAIFPSKSYMDYVLHYFPSTNKKKLYAVWNFRSFDEETIRILENTAYLLSHIHRKNSFVGYTDKRLKKNKTNRRAFKIKTQCEKY